MRGRKKLANARTGLKNSIKVALLPKNRSKRYVGLLGIVIAAYSWGYLQNSGTSIDSNPVAQNRLIDFQEMNNSLENDLETTLEKPTHKAKLISASFVPNAIQNGEELSQFGEKSLETVIDPETIEKERVFHKIKRGETLGSIMQAYEFPTKLPYLIVNADNGKHFKRIRVGKQIEFVLNKDTNALEAIHYPHSKLTRLVANVKDNISVNIEEIPHDIVDATASGSITHSLFGAASEAGISDNMIMELAEVFGWDIDFVRDIRKGDSFKLIYEQHVNGDNVLQEGDIVAAEFINKGQKFTAIRHIDADGNAGYYAPDGGSMKGTFLKSPMKFSRVSSGFSKKRFHPVLKKWRAHKGVDYAARTGTPIRSVANGKIIHRGTKGGYGRTIILSHGGKYTTLYAHMSKYHPKIKSGKHVKQGQIIGYVGATGLATGPHLHYEFRVNGVHRNPLTYKTPKASAITAKEKPNFDLVVEKQMLALSNIRSKSADSNMVAAVVDILKGSDDKGTSNNAIESALK